MRKKVRSHKYVDIYELYGYKGAPKRTKVWDVSTKYDEPLGYIKWYSPWRCYVFEPDNATIYNSTCMETIAGFIANEMENRKVKK